MHIFSKHRFFFSGSDRWLVSFWMQFSFSCDERISISMNWNLTFQKCFIPISKPKKKPTHTYTFQTKQISFPEKVTISFSLEVNPNVELVLLNELTLLDNFKQLLFLSQMLPFVVKWLKWNDCLPFSLQLIKMTCYLRNSWKCHENIQNI